jgi:diaminohydroxyphosphoribosylaminopyrimidine deaminase / 5-amino-6-(5-phosphoribosylamino)uracil reductase
MVGAVVYAGDEKVGEGYHPRFTAEHAEVVALAAAGDRARCATLYVTLEPCNHHGRNPPCTAAIIQAGIARVVSAVRDPNPVAAGGAETLRAAGISIEFGVREREARELNAPFFNAVATDRSWVTLKLALSLDGALSGADRAGGWLSGDASRTEVHRMRAGSDAIAVGVETALADDPQLTARFDPPPRVPPLRIVFDRSARLSPDSTLAKTAREIPTLVVTASSTTLPQELERLGVEAMRAHDVGDALRKLRERGIQSLMVEGGAGLAASFLAGDYVDRLVIFRAPLILGAGALNAFAGIASQEIEHAPRFTLLETRSLGDDVMSIYAPRRD